MILLRLFEWLTRWRVRHLTRVEALRELLELK